MISINGEDWQVCLVYPFDPILLIPKGAYAIGVCDNETKTIYINRALDQQEFEKVLCHELTHAAMEAYNVNLEQKEEELIADIIATFGEEIIDTTNKIFNRIKRGRY